MDAAHSIEPGHRRYIAVETGISIVLNVLVSAAFAWFPFHGVDRVPLWGGLGIAVDLVPTTFMITLMVGIALTLLTRRRVRTGQVPGLKAAAIRNRWIRRLPRRAVWRALAMALALTGVLVPAFVTLFVAVGVSSLAFSAFFIFKLVYGAILAIIVTPVILSAALADPIGRPGNP